MFLCSVSCLLGLVTTRIESGRSWVKHHHHGLGLFSLRDVTSPAQVVQISQKKNGVMPQESTTAALATEQGDSTIAATTTTITIDEMDMDLNGKNARHGLRNDLLTTEGGAVEYDNGEATTTTTTATTSETQAIIHLLKGNIGPGCLSLPWAFSQLGLFWGVVWSVVLCVWTSYCAWVTVVIKRRYPDRIRTYPDVGTWAYGPHFGHFVRICICVQQTAICTVYMSFVGANLLAIWNRDDGGGSGSSALQHTVVMTLALPAVIGMSCLASLRAMAPCSAAGGVTLFVSLALIAAVAVQEWPHRPQDTTPSSSSVFAVYDAMQAPLAICAILFSFEGVCLVIPVEHSMTRPQSFPSIFWFINAVVCGVFIVVAGGCLLAFGRVSNGSITAYLLANLLSSDDNNDQKELQFALLTIANTFASVSVLLTYPLQMYPALQLIGPLFSRKPTDRGDVVPTSDDQEVFRNEDDEMDDDNNASSSSSSSGIQGDSATLRLGYVLVTYLVAVAVPNVQLLISLAGALAGSSTALLIPPLLELEFLKRDGRGGCWTGKARCYILFVVGFIFLTIGVGAAIVDIVQAYRHGAV